MVARLGAIPVQRALVSALLVLASPTKASPGGLTADSAAKFALEASGGAPNNQIAPEEQAPAQWFHAVESQVWSACVFPSGRDVTDCSRRLLLPLNLGPAAAIER